MAVLIILVPVIIALAWFFGCPGLFRKRPKAVQKESAKLMFSTRSDGAPDPKPNGTPGMILGDPLSPTLNTKFPVRRRSERVGTTSDTG